MDTFRCTHCGEEHDLSKIEPSFDRPDAYFVIPEAERSERSWNSESFCVIWESESSPRRHFLRVLLPIPVRGDSTLNIHNQTTWSRPSAATFVR